MNGILPYPLLSLALLVLWLLLNQSVSAGHVILGSVIAVLASWAMAALRPEKPRIRRPGTAVRLLGLVLADILRSNLAVGRIIVRSREPGVNAGFLTIPLDLRSRQGLAVLVDHHHLHAWHDLGELRRRQGYSAAARSRPGRRDGVGPDDQGSLRAAADGDLRMNALAILGWAITGAQVLLGLAMCCATFRLVAGPRAQDRILGLDTLYVSAMLMLVTFGIRTGSTLYFEAALVIALLGFVSTVALAKFLMRGEVIE